MKCDGLSLSPSSLQCSLTRANLTCPMGEQTGAAFEEGGAPTAASIGVVLRWNQGFDLSSEKSENQTFQLFFRPYPGIQGSEVCAPSRLSH